MFRDLVIQNDHESFSDFLRNGIQLFFLFFFTHFSSGSEPLRGIGSMTGGGTEQLLITAGYMFLIRVPNLCSFALMTINSIPQPLTSVLASENFQQSGLIISLKLWLGLTTWPKRFLSPFSTENSIFIEIPREGRGIERVKPEAVCLERLRAIRSNLSATAAPCSSAYKNHH